MENPRRVKRAAADYQNASGHGGFSTRACWSETRRSSRISKTTALIGASLSSILRFTHAKLSGWARCSSTRFFGNGITLQKSAPRRESVGRSTVESVPWLTTMTKTKIKEKIDGLTTLIQGYSRQTAKRRFVQASIRYLYCLVAFAADAESDWAKLPHALDKRATLEKLLNSIHDADVVIGDGFTGHVYRDFLLRDLFGF